jgi:hypothetical protein
MTSNAACAKRIYYRGGTAGLLCWRIHLTGGRNGLHQTRSSAEGYAAGQVLIRRQLKRRAVLGG